MSIMYIMTFDESFDPFNELLGASIPKAIVDIYNNRPPNLEQWENGDYKAFMTLETIINNFGSTQNFIYVICYLIKYKDIKVLAEKIKLSSRDAQTKTFHFYFYILFTCSFLAVLLNFIHFIYSYTDDYDMSHFFSTAIYFSKLLFTLSLAGTIVDNVSTIVSFQKLPCGSYKYVIRQATLILDAYESTAEAYSFQIFLTFTLNVGMLTYFFFTMLRLMYFPKSYVSRTFILGLLAWGINTMYLPCFFVNIFNFLRYQVSFKRYHQISTFTLFYLYSFRLVLYIIYGNNTYHNA